MRFDNNYNIVDLKKYSCGCGFFTQQKSQFKDHVLSEHKGKYLQKSTHYLSDILLIVLPASQTKQLKPRLRPHTRHTYHQEQAQQKKMEIITQDDEANRSTTISPVATEKKKQRGRRKNQICQPKAQSQCLIPKEVKNDQKNDQKIQWNGFQLVKNNAVNAYSFFCGNCEQTIENAQEFIIHCIQVCQQLHHDKSSHFLKATFQHSTQQKEEFGSPLNQQDEPAIDNVNKQHIKRKKQMKNFLKKYERCDESNTLFFCGHCNQTLKWTSFQSHFIYLNEIIHPQSSHVILRRKVNIYCRHLKLLVNKERDNQKRYFCCCNWDKEFTMNELFQHIIQVHKGVSPIYNL